MYKQKRSRQSETDFQNCTFLVARVRPAFDFAADIFGTALLRP